MNDIDKYMQGVNDFLVEKYGKIKPEWGATLMLLDHSLRRYVQIRELLDQEGLFDSSNYKKNPLITSEKDIIATILKLTQKLGVSPWDQSKIKVEEDDDTGDFIEELTGNNE